MGEQGHVGAATDLWPKETLHQGAAQSTLHASTPILCHQQQDRSDCMKACLAAGLNGERRVEREREKNKVCW